MPELNQYEVAEPLVLPVLKDGIWQVEWTLREMTDLEKDKVDNPLKYSFAQRVMDANNINQEEQQ